MVTDERFPRKTDRADQTVSRRDLESPYNVTEACPNRPDEGATAIKSTKSLITPKPSVAGSSVLCHWNHWILRFDYDVSMRTFAYLQKTWPKKFEHLLDKVNGGRSEQNSVGLFDSRPQRSVRNLKEIGHWVRYCIF